jgi:hypothetical protein
MKSARKMELGAEPTKVVILAVLGAVAGYLVYTNLLAGPEDPVEPPKAAPARPVRKAMDQVAKAEQQAGITNNEEAPAAGANKVIPGRRTQGEFRPTMKPRGAAQDPSKLDPTLRLDYLAKLQKVQLSGAGRSLFDFAPTPPPAAKPKQPEPKIEVKTRPVQGPELPPPPPPPPVKPPPPPIPLKFYGSSLPISGGAKRVFCMQNDEIFTPAEGDVIMKRYRIVRIAPSSVVVEDLDHKNEQTLPIEEIPRSG